MIDIIDVTLPDIWQSSSDVQTLKETLAQDASSQLIPNCDPSKEFCISIATYLPLLPLYMGLDKVLTYSTTCFKLYID